MKKARTTVAIMVTLLSCACGTSDPITAFNELSEALEKGDRETFFQGLTEESRTFLQGLAALESTHPEVLKFGPYPVNVRGVSSRRRDELAYVDVETSTDPPRYARVIMRFEDSKWRLDLVSTEWAWSRNWSLSGGKPKILFELPPPEPTGGPTNGQRDEAPLP